MTFEVNNLKKKTFTLHNLKVKYDLWIIQFRIFLCKK